MDMRGFQNYKGQAVSTMTQGELLLLLYDELIKRLTRAELTLNMQQPDYALFEASVDRSLEIVRYLNATLDHKYPISGNLARLYDYFCYELNRVKAGRNRTELERVKTMLSELRDSFRTAQASSESGK